MKDIFDIRIEKQMDFHMSKKTWGGKIHYSEAVICRYMTYETAEYIKCICHCGKYHPLGSLEKNGKDREGQKEHPGEPGCVFFALRSAGFHCKIRRC